MGDESKKRWKHLSIAGVTHHTGIAGWNSVYLGNLSDVRVVIVSVFLCLAGPGFRGQIQYRSALSLRGIG
jgi:hypothetical protein